MKPLPIGTRVRIRKHRPGWTGEVAYHSDTCGFYTLRNLCDPAGRAQDRKHDGPYTRGELEEASK